MCVCVCVTPTMKHRGGSVMVSDSFAGSRINDLHSGRHREPKLIPQHFAAPCNTLCKMPHWFILQQDNDPKHTSRLSELPFRSKVQDGVLQIMEWPVQSPGLNPIELVWDELN